MSQQHAILILVVAMLLMMLQLSSVDAWTTAVYNGYTGSKKTSSGSGRSITRRLQQNNRVCLGHARRLRPLPMASESEKDEAARLIQQATKLRAEAEKLEAGRPKPATAKKEEPVVAAEASKPKARDKGVSSSMKEKLRRELVSQGGDPDRASGNPILIVSAIVALLVIIGGKGFFYGVPATVGLEEVLRHMADFSSSVSA